MNCKTIERWIMLNDAPRRGEGGGGTGELSPRRQRKLAAHLTTCASCQTYRQQLQRMGALVSESLPNGDPSEQVLINIRREARVSAPAPRRSNHGLAPWWRPTYGLASVVALCAVLLGGWWLRPDANGLAGEAQLRTILMMLSEDLATLEGDAHLTTASDDSDTLDTLAEALLILQGLDEEYTEVELSAPSAALPATAPLTRNNGASRAGRYG